MDWCLDTGVPGARQALEADVVAHLRRRSTEPVAVELAAGIVHRTVEHLAGVGGCHWVTLDWQQLLPRFGVRTLPPEAGLPGLPLGEGLTAAFDRVGQLSAACEGDPGLWVVLGTPRPPEPDLDPVTDGSGLPATPVDFVAGVATTIVGGPDGATGEQLAATAGALAANGAEAAYRRRTGAVGPLTAADVAAAFIGYENSIGADFFLVGGDERRVVLGNRRCPFGDQVVGRPAMCRLTSATAGALAARAAGRAAVTLDERLALGDHQCRLVVELGSPSEPAASHVYSDPPAGIPNVEADGGPAGGYRVAVTLRLPRDRMSVPLTRRLAEYALGEVGVRADVTGDVTLALSEACGNVLRHAGEGDDYSVVITIGNPDCEIRVIDIGHGFDHASLAEGMPDADSEQGRGLALMRALMDEVKLDSRPERGTVVRLVKRLEFDPGSPAQALLRRSDIAGAAPPDA